MEEVFFSVNRLFHLNTSASHRGARCLRSSLAYLMGLYCWRISVSNSLVPIGHWSEWRFSMRASSAAFDAARWLVAISLSSRSGGRFLSSSLLMELARRRIRSVDNFSGLDSKASVSQ